MSWQSRRVSGLASCALRHYHRVHRSADLPAALFPRRYFVESSAVCQRCPAPALTEPCRLAVRALSTSTVARDKGPAKGNAVDKKGKTNTSAWPLLRSMWPRSVEHNARIGFAFTGLIVGKALAIYAPLQLGAIVDALGAGAEALPVGLLAAYGLSRLSTSALNELRSALFANVSQATCRALARRSFEHLHSLDAAYLVSSKPGALNVVVNRATQSLTQVLNMTLFNVLPVLVEFMMALAVMGTLAGPACVGWVVLTIGSYVAFTAHYSNIRREMMKRRNKAEEQVSSVFYDSLANCELVKYFQSEGRETKRYDAALAKFETEQVKVLHSLATLNFGQQFIVVSGFTGVLALTSAQVLSGALPVGDVVAINGILVQLMQPLGILGGVYRVTTQGFVDLGKVADFLNLASAAPPPAGGGLPFDYKGGQLEFRDVHHSYTTDGNPTLSGASLVVRPGTRAAIVGPSGSGKSTLLRLLYRFQDPQSGQVLIDGQDVKTMDPVAFRKHLGIVPQDCALFNESIGYNVRYGRPDASEEDVEKAVRAAQLHELLDNMPEGLDTPVGERGLMLSGGERQRVGIARAMLRDPSIVLLDEATSALDVRTERALVDAMEELMKGRTCLIVAHRLSTVQSCDVVAFVEDGKISEQGSHDELLERSEGYRRFWEGAPVEA